MSNEQIGETVATVSQRRRKSVQTCRKGKRNEKLLGGYCEMARRP